MANNKREFKEMYDESVEVLKKFKQSNDNLNKSIGIQQNNSIVLKIRGQKESYDRMIDKIDKLLEKLEQSYLDPDTARKIGTVKQQYKIQKDRRQYLLQSIGKEKQNLIKIPHQTSESQNFIKFAMANSQQYHKNSNNAKKITKDHYEISQNSTAHTLKNKYQEQVIQYDHEIQCKLLQQKNAVISETQKTIINVYQIHKDMKQMVQYQGQNLQIISDQIFKAKVNVVKATQQIKEANQIDKKRRKKVVTFSIFMILAIAVVLGILIL